MVVLINDYTANIDGEDVERMDTCSRLIFCYRGVIYKFDNSDEPQDGEVPLWHNLEPDDRKYFAKIKGYGSGWVAQEYEDFCEPENNPDLAFELFNNIVLPLASKYGILDLDAYCNWGIRPDGTPVIYDYGLIKWEKLERYKEKIQWNTLSMAFV